MLKNELVLNIAKAMGEDGSKKAAKEALDIVLQAIAEGVKADGLVQLPGFGTFKKKFRPEREGPKPGTTEKMTYPASTTVTFKAGKGLKDLVHDA